MRILSLLAMVLVCVLLFGCQHRPTTQAPEAPSRLSTPESAQDDAGWRHAQEDDIREAVFRYQFRYDPSGMQQHVKVFFLSMCDEDPSDEFMKRFRGDVPPVKPQSQSVIDPHGLQTKDKASGEPGMLFRVDSIEWIGDREVRVEGGYHVHGRAAASHVYQLTKEDGAWRVTSDEITVIS